MRNEMKNVKMENGNPQRSSPELRKALQPLQC